MSDLEERMRRIEDREAIRELRATYCFLVDDGRGDELVDDHFTEDACCDFRAARGDITPLVSKGREEVRHFFTQVVPALLRDMSHTVHNHRITLDGDRASGECYFELTATEGSTGDAVVGAGRYLDRYRRVDGEWRFEERNARIFHIARFAEGWARQPFLPALSAGGPTDD
jgi:ketosteroid isomerase-like protein